MDKPTIMIVEDDDMLLQAITKKLQLNHFNTLSSVRGAQALSYLNEMEKLPDVIWLDFQLTDMDGRVFMKKMRENHKLDNIPIFVISNSVSQANVNAMMDYGVKQYLLKAKYRLDEIIKIIVDYIETNKKSTT